jgi:Zn-dependent protease
LRGVPVVVSPSWLLTELLLGALYGPVIEDAVPDVDAVTAYAAAFGFALLFGLCVFAHEAGHTLLSLRLGHPVRRIVLFALGGVSEMDEEPARARDELLITAAGPLVSALLAAASGAAYAASPPGGLLTALLALLLWSNAALAVFNLLPGLPLDGGRLVRAAAIALGARPLTATRIAAWGGRVIAVALLLTAVLLDHSAAGLAGAVFTAAVAAYLWIGAGQALQLARLLDRVPALTVTGLRRPGLLLPGDVSVAEALARAHRDGAGGLVVVDAADRPTAIVDEARIGSVPVERRPWTPVGTVARPLEAGLTLPDDLAGEDLLARMRATPASEYLVLDPEGHPVGVVATRDLVSRLKGHL